MLSEHIDVHLFFTNPSQFYWGDLTQYRQRTIARINFKTEDARTDYLAPNAQAVQPDQEEHWLEFHGNPLLANFGKIGRDFLHVLSQYDDLNEIEAFTEPTTPGLLGEVQRAVYHLAPIQADARNIVWLKMMAPLLFMPITASAEKWKDYMISC
ncbi:exodeoxyribonuclease V subunit gamma [Wohlfahrtiimonas chitiniclastica]|nr:exodeoxyribonuclease V subunit gamma [Wohlfahrtiimonas chitiniclastica]